MGLCNGIFEVLLIKIPKKQITKINRVLVLLQQSLK